MYWLKECCFVYNYILDKRIEKRQSRFDAQALLPKMKTRWSELKTINSQTLQDVNKRIDEAFKLFFQRVKAKKEKAGFPRFRGIDRYDSFTLKQTGYKLENSKLIIKNIGIFKLRLHRQIQGNIKTITIKRSLTNKWHVCFSCDNIPTKPLKSNLKSNSIGIDLGIKSFLTNSDSDKVANPKYLKASQDILAIRQQKLSRSKKYSNKRIQKRLLVAKMHEKIQNQRLDFLHKLSRSYINTYDIICHEDLNIKSMLKNNYKIMNKSISDVAWRSFINMLTYKAEEAGKLTIKVNPKYTSQMCSQCNKLVPKKLSERIHSCPHCGLTLDRDHNAAINIHKLGMEKYGAGIVLCKPAY